MLRVTTEQANAPVCEKLAGDELMMLSAIVLACLQRYKWFDDDDDDERVSRVVVDDYCF